MYLYNLLYYILEQHEVHFIDVSEEVFMEYAKMLLLLYRGPIKSWNEVQGRRYSKPFYTADSNVKEEAQKFLMAKDDHLTIVQTQLAAFNRKCVQIDTNGNYVSSYSQAGQIQQRGIYC